MIIPLDDEVNAAEDDPVDSMAISWVSAFMITAKRLGLLICAALLTLCIASDAKTVAAEISVQPEEGNSVARIFIQGRLENGDQFRFRKIALNFNYADVVLQSNGGQMDAAIELGKAIRLMGYSTRVEQGDCVSACVLVWLAGETRYLGAEGAIGAHAAFVYENGKRLPDTSANAIIGSYLGSLGYGTRIVEFLTSTPPDEVVWLTPGIAKQIGLVYDSPEVGLVSAETLKQFDEAATISADESDKTGREVGLYWDTASSGYAGAQNSFGELFERGQKVDRNDLFAVYWYTRAAERGEPAAFLRLASILSGSDAGPIQMIEAYKYAVLAESELPGKYNRKRASDLKAEIAKRMTAGDLRVAEALAGRWRPLFQEKNIMGDP